MSSNQEDYRAGSIIDRLSLKDIRVAKLVATLERESPALSMVTSASISGMELEKGDELVLYRLYYEFSAKTNERLVWEVLFTLALTFSLSSPDEREEDLREFGASHVVRIAHPYARELVHSTTTRMSVPQYILDVLPLTRLRHSPRAPQNP